MTDVKVTLKVSREQLPTLLRLPYITDVKLTLETSKELPSSEPSMKKESAPVVDSYNGDILKRRFYSHKQYVQDAIKIRDEIKLPIRLPNMPEDISENIVKMILYNHPGQFQDKTSKWTKSIMKKGQKITGDLVSEKEGTQECKCFTSDGPPSFGPQENWDVIYFLDARGWLSDKFVLWRIPLSNKSTEWKSIKMNKNETHESQSAQGRRPRITWESLKPQIERHCQKVFEGSFDDIFNQKAVE